MTKNKNISLNLPFGKRQCCLEKQKSLEKIKKDAELKKIKREELYKL